MNTRYRWLLLAAVTFALLVGVVAVWFAIRGNNQQPAVEQPATPKTAAELLVGSWKMTKCHHPPIAPDVETWITFAAGGRFEVHGNDHFHGHQVRVGTYQLEGNTLRFSAEATGRYPAESWEEHIESITERNLILVGSPDTGGKQPRAEYQRTDEKPDGLPKQGNRT